MNGRQFKCSETWSLQILSSIFFLHMTHFTHSSSSIAEPSLINIRLFIYILSRPALARRSERLFWGQRFINVRQQRTYNASWLYNSLFI